MAAGAAPRAPRIGKGQSRTPKRRAGTRSARPPLEHRILMTATLCLLAFGAVMVYSASSPLGVLNGQGSGTGDFVRYLVFGGLGLAAMHLLERRGLALLDRHVVNLLLLGSFVLLVLVLVPGFGVQVNGARRWFAAGPDPVSAVGADEDRAGPVRGSLPGRPPQADARLSPGDCPDRHPGGAGLPADRRRARPGHRAGGGVHDDHAAAGGRDAAALPARCWRRSPSARCSCWRSSSRISARG